jgi:hypothetical protein
LSDWMLLRRSQVRSLVHLLITIVVVPVLARLEAGNQRVAGGLCVRCRVLRGRGVTAAYVAALSAPS